jgi:hypothetical protein
VSALSVVEDFQVLEEHGGLLQSGAPPSAVEQFDLAAQDFAAAAFGDPAEFLDVHVDRFAGISPWREPQALFPSTARGAPPAGSKSSTSARPPGQAAFSTLT